MEETVVKLCGKILAHNSKHIVIIVGEVKG